MDQIVDDALEETLKFLEQNTVCEDFVTADEGMVLHIKHMKQQEIKEISQKCKVQIEPVSADEKCGNC